MCEVHLPTKLERIISMNFLPFKVFLVISAWVIPEFAFAFGFNFDFGGNSSSPVSQGLGWIIKQMYGGTGPAIATLSIMGVGLLCLGRVIEWKYLLYTVGGIAIIFGAGTIAQGIKNLIS